MVVSVDVNAILDIAEVQNTITIQLNLKLTWLDTRLRLMNLKEDRNLNTLTPEFREKIWIPQVVFYNTQQKLESLNDHKSFAVIDRLGGFEQSAKSELFNALYYKGGENPITTSRVYDSEFLCEFSMAVFPFDTQRCKIIMIMSGNTGKFVDISAGDMNYLGPVDLTQYFVKETYMLQSDLPVLGDNSTHSVEVHIVFGRRVLATILTTYLPTTLLCIVCFSTNYFKAFFFEAIVTVNLTSLLVLTTLFISVSESLPKTSYIKMMDAWLLFNLFVPFSEVLLHTFIDSLREEDKREINHHGSSINVDANSQGNIKVGKFNHQLIFF